MSHQPMFAIYQHKNTGRPYVFWSDRIIALHCYSFMELFIASMGVGGLVTIITRIFSIPNSLEPSGLKMHCSRDQKITTNRHFS